MCLLCPIKTPPEGDYKTAWKVLEWDPYSEKWVTPHRRADATQTLEAFGKPDFDRYGHALHGGAIHCFRTKQLAIREARAYNSYINRYDVFEVHGIVHVAHNGTEIAFRKVKFKDKLSEWYVP